MAADFVLITPQRGETLKMIKKDLESRAGFGTNLRVYETGLYNATHRDVSAALQAGHRLAEQRQITRDLDLTLAESYWFNLYK